ncbi:MAG: hypothetical protein ABSG94_12880 [Brevinematales bacterium]
MKILLAFFFFSGLFLINACSAGNTKGENLIINNYNDKEQSVLLSQKGIHLYNIMVEKEDITLAPNIKNILEESLKLDSKNQQAGLYLQKTDNFTHETIAKDIKAVKTGLNKWPRSEDNNYSLCIKLQTVYQLDPSNNEILSLRDKTTNLREFLAGDILSNEDIQIKSIEQISNKIIQGKTLLPDMDKFGKALLLGSSRDNDITAKISDLANILSGDMDFIVSETKILIEKTKYHDADLRFKLLDKYNIYVNHKFDAVINDLQYNFYFSWSEKLYDSKLYDPASEKIGQALSSKKTDAALELQVKIQSKKNTADVTASFSYWISEIDAMIEQKEIAAAYQKINYIKSLTKEKDKVAELDNRKAALNVLIEPVYKDSVADFIDGNYSTAVKGFENVLAVAPNYKDAANYLKKAKSELKILELY